MIDWGIVAFFVVQLAIAFAVYHAWNGVKAEKSVLIAETARILGVTAEFKKLADRMDAIEKAPAERVARVAALEDAAPAIDRRLDALVRKIEAVDVKVNSVNGRIAAKAKAARREAGINGDGDQDPDPQGEEREQAQAPHSPGSFRHVEQPQASAIPSGFGVVRRAV